MPVPPQPKIYHIVHADRLASVMEDGFLWCDALMAEREPVGTTIGMSTIKQRRLTSPIRSHPNLNVGDCVPFYFCPRSIMLYLIHRANDPELTYRGGQEPILHLECDFHTATRWAARNKKRWAFTLSNAGARYFEDRSDVAQLEEIDWDAVRATQWSGQGISSQVKEGKQAEFLVEERFPWQLVERIGVRSRTRAQWVADRLAGSEHRPRVEIKQDWYY